MTADVESLIADLQKELYGPASWSDTVLMSRSIDALRSQAERIKALEAKCALLAASLDQEDRRVDGLREIINRIPQTPEQIIAFIGSNFDDMQPEGWTGALPEKPTGDLSMVKYSLSVHDLLSAFSWADLDRASIDAAIAAQAGSKEAS